jgi:hypothetical protein
MDSELGNDLPVLVALVRAQARFETQHPAVEIDEGLLSSRLRSETSRRVARAILGKGPTDEVLLEKVRAIRYLALGR